MCGVPKKSLLFHRCSRFLDTSRSLTARLNKSISSHDKSRSGIQLIWVLTYVDNNILNFQPEKMSPFWDIKQDIYRIGLLIHHKFQKNPTQNWWPWAFLKFCVDVKKCKNFENPSTDSRDMKTGPAMVGAVSNPFPQRPIAIAVWRFSQILALLSYQI